MTLDIKEGSRVETSEGEDLGAVRQFVVRPSKAELTHVLVEKGVFFTDDRVVPIEAIDRVEGDRIVLSGRVDPADLPRFVRDHYTPLDEETRGRLGFPGGPHLVWRHPTALVGPFPLYPAYPMPPARPTHVDDPDTRSRVTEGEVIGPRTPVVSTRGEKLGTVSEMHVDEDGHLSHLIVDLGFLDGVRVLPEHWIDSIDADGVRVAVGDAALDTLETLT